MGPFSNCRITKLGSSSIHLRPRPKRKKYLPAMCSKFWKCLPDESESKSEGRMNHRSLVKWYPFWRSRPEGLLWSHVPHDVKVHRAIHVRVKCENFHSKKPLMRKICDSRKKAYPIEPKSIPWQIEPLSKVFSVWKFLKMRSKRSVPSQQKRLKISECEKALWCRVPGKIVSKAATSRHKMWFSGGFQRLSYQVEK